MTIESLYEDEAFNGVLLTLSRHAYLPFDDFKGEVFLHLVEFPTADPKKSAKRIAMRMRRQQAREATSSVDVISETYEEEMPASLLWEDRHFITT
jgi:hypothetical protein